MWRRCQVLASLTKISTIALPIRHVGAQPAGTMPSMQGMVMNSTGLHRELLALRAKYGKR
jgi:hypothetical protein